MSLGIDDDPLGSAMSSSSFDCHWGFEIQSPVGTVGSTHARADQYKAGGTRAFLNAAGRGRRAQRNQQRMNGKRKQRRDLLRNGSSPRLGSAADWTDMQFPSELPEMEPIFGGLPPLDLPKLGSAGDGDELFSTPRTYPDESDGGIVGLAPVGTDVKKPYGGNTMFDSQRDGKQTLWIKPSLETPPISIEAEATMPDLKGAIAEALGRPKQAAFVLRHPDGYVVPIEYASLIDSSTDLEHPLTIEDVAGGHAAPVRPQHLSVSRRHSAGAGILEWVQKPPYGAAVWLHAKLTKSGNIADSTATHIFDPPPAIKLLPGSFPDGPEAEKRLLESATVRLFDSGHNDMSHLLYTGQPQMTRQTTARCFGDAGLCPQIVLSWPKMAILDVCRPVDGVSDSLSAADLQSRRGATGFFMMSVEIPGFSPLWLTAADGKPAKIVIKNERLSLLGEKQGRSWRRLGCGPYADHTKCNAEGTHVDANGIRLCVPAPSCGGNSCRPCLKPVPANTPRAQVKMEKC